MKRIKEIFRAFGLCYGLYLLFAFFASVLFFMKNGFLDYSFQIVLITGMLSILGAVIYIHYGKMKIGDYYRYMSLIISASLLIHFITQGARNKNDKIIFIGLYVVDIIAAILVALLILRKIVIHNNSIKKMIKIMGKVLGVLLIVILCVGRVLTGRRGAFFINYIFKDSKNFLIWILLMVISFIFLFIGVVYSVINIINRKDNR